MDVPEQHRSQIQSNRVRHGSPTRRRWGRLTPRRVSGTAPAPRRGPSTRDASTLGLRTPPVLSATRGHSPQGRAWSHRVGRCTSETLVARNAFAGQRRAGCQCLPWWAEAVAVPVHRREGVTTLELEHERGVHHAVPMDRATGPRGQARFAVVPRDWAGELRVPWPGWLWCKASGAPCRARAASRGTPRGSPPTGPSSHHRPGRECSAEGARVLARHEDAPRHRRDEDPRPASGPIHPSQCRSLFGGRRPPGGGPRLSW